MKNLKVDFEVVQRIGLKILVDKNGKLRVFWRKEPNLIGNVLPDIDTAIRQGIHVVEGYHGIMVKVGKEKLLLPGEVQNLSKMIKRLQGIISKFLEPRELSLKEACSIRLAFQKCQGEISRATNRFKLIAKIRLGRMPPLRNERGRKSGKVLVETGKVTLDLLERLNEIGEITFGVALRTRKLIEEKLRIERTFLSVYRRLGKFLKELQVGVDYIRLKSIVNEISEGKVNLLAGLLSIKVMPYLKRVRSREITRLAKLPKYLAEGKKDTIYRALENAFKKIRPVVLERESRRRKKIKLTID